MHGYVVLDQTAKLLAELATGSMQSAPNCPDRHSQDRPDLLVPQTIELFHHHDGSVIGRQRVQCLLDQSVALGAL